MFKSQTVRKSTGMIILLLFLANAVSAQELTEGNAASWGSFAADGAVTRVLDDAERVKVGTRSIKFVTKSAVNTGIRFPSAANAHWNLTDKDHLTFWAYAINKNVYGFEGNQPNIVL